MFSKLKRDQRIKKVFFWVLDIPLVNSAYRNVYNRRINSRLKEFAIPPSISIEPYNVCNLACIMCPYQNMTRKKEMMSFPLYKKIIDDAVQLGIKSVNLSFYNEPLLDSQLFDRISYAKKNDLFVSFFSNGTLLNKDKIEKLLACPPDLIIFSFDGATKEVYDNIRIGAKFEIVKQNILNLIEARTSHNLTAPVIQINFTIQKGNVIDTKKFENLWKNRADNVDFGIVDNRKSSDLIGNMDVHQPKNIFPCRRLWTELMVMSNGKVALCCMDSDGKSVIGDLSKQSIKEVWNGSVLGEIRKHHLAGNAEKVPFCKGCFHLYRHNTYSWWL